MILELSYYSVTLFATTVILSLLAAYVWQRRSVSGGRYFALLMAAAAEWAFIGALEYSAIDIGTEITFARLTYLGALAILPLWFLFILDYCNLSHWITRRNTALLWALPAIAAVLVFTNDYHGLIWSSIVPVHTELGVALIYNKSIGFWIIIIYSVALVIPGLLMLVRKTLRGGDNNKHLTAIVLLGSVFIELSSVISELGQYILRGVDITPFAFAIVGLVVSWGIYRHHFFELTPTAAEGLIEAMADGVLVLDQHGRIVRINLAAQRIFRVPGKAVGQQAEKVLAEWPCLAEHLKSTNGSTCELTIGSRDDKDAPRWIDASLSSLRDRNTRPMGTLIILRDMTERKLAEESLRKSEKDRLKAEQLANIGYYDWDLKRREAEISEGSARIFGFPDTNITYAMFTGRIHPEDRKRILEEIHFNVEQGLAHLLEFKIVRPDGSVRHVRSESEAAIRDAAGTPVRQFGIVQDITERKLAEEALHLSEARYKTMVETAGEGICILDKEDRLVFVNKKISDLTGFTYDEVYGQSAYEFIGSEDHDTLRKNLAAKRLGISEQYDYRLSCKDGGSVWVIASASPLYDEKGEFMATLAMLTDITDRKRADEQLKISLKEKEALLKEVHHRVKNNLQIITSLLNLQSNGIDDPKYTDMIRDSQNRIKSMALIHEQLYKSSDLSSIDISEYLDGLINNLSRSFIHSSGNVTFRTEIEHISMDIDRAVPIGIIVTELVSNSIKYAFPDGRTGEVLVELHRAGEKNILSISDNGVGLPEGFEIGNASTLGLQLVEMLVQQIDGNLKIERGERMKFEITINH